MSACFLKQHFYLYYPPNQAVWLTERYDDQLVYTDDKWAFRRVNLKSRFFTTHEAGWANVPHLLEQP